VDAARHLLEEVARDRVDVREQVIGEVVPTGVEDRDAIERAAGASVCTSTRPPASPRPARPASCVTSANVRSSARKSGKRSV